MSTWCSIPRPLLAVTDAAVLSRVVGGTVIGRAKLSRQAAAAWRGPGDAGCRRWPSAVDRLCWGSSSTHCSATLAAPTPTRQNRLPSIRSTEHVRRLTHPRGVDTGETGTDTSTGTGTDTGSTTQEIPT